MSEFNLQQLEDFLNIAKDAIVLAGDHLSSGKKSSREVHASEGHDIKLAADQESEKIIIDYLTARSSFSILSEEKGLIKSDDSGYLWIIDPVDGTMNYSREIPLCCVSIGLWKDDNPILGIVYDFNRGDFFSGIVGRGAWHNDHKIKVSEVQDKSKGILATGFPSKMDYSDENLLGFVKSVQGYKKVRLLGTATLSLIYVACGLIDAYFEKNIMLWDIAGAFPVILEAGGYVEKQKTSISYSFDVFASNGLIKK